MSRPFLAKSVSFSVRPAATTAPVNGTLTSIDALFRVGPTGLTEVSNRQPAVGTDDQALGPVLRDAVARKVAQPTGTTRTVAGRECHDIRFAEPVAGPLKTIGSVDGHDDLCLDSDGLVLREEWTLRGRVVLRKTALEVTTSPGGLDAALSAAGAAPRATDVPAATSAPLTSPDAWFPAPAPPAGYTLASAIRFAFPDPQHPGQVAYTSEVWAFSKGADMVTVEAGAGGAPWHPDDVSEPSSIGGAAGTKAIDATSVVRNDGAELRALVPGEHVRWVRVRGTTSVADLEAYARTLPSPATD